ncbi:MAG: PA14 domain-containing protein [Bacteroidota bacterium]
MIESFGDSANVSTKETLLDLRNINSVVHDGGLLGIALHPDFGLPTSPNRNYIYVYQTVKGPDGRSGPFACADRCFTCFSSVAWYGSYLRLSRFSLIEGTYRADPASEQILLSIRQFNGSHRGGGLLFGNDGMLYLSIGDQARYEGAQNISDNFEGGVIRIDVDRQGGAISHPPRRKMGQQAGYSEESTGTNYYIPSDNPFINPDSSWFEEFYAVGLRNPHRMTVDRFSGDIWIGDVGHASKEEIDVVEKGANYGWPIYEANIGPIARCNTDQVGIGTLTPPFAEISRREVECIIGGYVYRGAKHPSLYGKYIFGGCTAKRIYAREEGEESELLMTFLPEGSLMTFGEDSDGEILIGRKQNSTTLFRLISRNANPPAPALLSQTGAFRDLASLEPNDGIIPYEMIESFWSDGAEKFRWMAVPNDGNPNSEEEQIKYSEKGNWRFPIGSVLIKHFELGGKRLETRFEVHAEDGKYYYLTYKWREDESEADLLFGALDEEVSVNGQSQIWHYPSRTECLTCHQPNAGFILGPKTRYLNSSISYPQSGETANQLYTLSHIGLLDKNLSEFEVEEISRFLSYDDPNASLEERARSYLDLNCSYCHQPGASNRAQFDARITTPLARQNLIFGGVNSPLGIDNAKVIVPGDINSSILFHRANSLTEGIAMPPLAKKLIDEEGVELLRNWIQNMEPRENSGGIGLMATYFHDDNLSELAFSRVDPAIEFNWGLASPDEQMDAESFSIRWEGELQSLQAGTYRFFLKSDEQVRLWIDRVLLIDSWGEGNPEEQEVSLDLAEKEKYKVRLEYRHLSDKAHIQFSWSGPEFEKESIPRYQLFPDDNAEQNLGGRGLLGTYYNNQDLSDKVMERVDPRLSFDWGGGSPDPNIEANTFSIRWEGNLEISKTGTYTFFTETDDGCRLWVDGELIIDKWVGQGATEWEGQIDLTAARSIPIRMEYFDDGGNASAKLRWKGPEITKQIIPTNNLFPPGEQSSNRPDPLCFPTSQGEVVIEAENYTSFFTGRDNAQWNYWEVLSNGDASEGKAMIAAPNLGIRARGLGGPRLDYSFILEEVGTYYVYVRTRRNPNTDGSFILGADGTPLMNPFGNGMGYSADWNWEDFADGKALKWEVSSPGKHFLNLWMREDGAIVDKIILRKESKRPEGISSLQEVKEVCQDDAQIFSLQEFGEDLLITWNIKLENGSYYLLERSIEGAPHSLLEEGRLPANFASYWDRGLLSLPQTKLLYRVRAFDQFDSQIGVWEQELDLGKGSGVLTFQSFPNPVSQQILLNFENPQRKSLSLKVLDMQGRELSAFEIGEGQRNGNFEFPAGDWADGIYFLLLSDGEELLTKRILVRK